MTDSRFDHIGEYIYEFVIEPLGMCITDCAKALGVSRGTLSRLLNCRAGLSVEMALRFEEAWGVDAKELLVKQVEYDLLSARIKEEAEVAQ